MKKTSKIITPSQKEKITDSLRVILQNLLSKKELSAETILDVVDHIMVVIGGYNTISGSDKKEIVITLIEEAINNVRDPDTRDTLLLMNKIIIPKTIDLLVSASKKKHKFGHNSKLKKFFNSLKCCLNVLK